jgi:integrase
MVLAGDSLATTPIGGTMGSLYIKGAKLWARYKDESGKWSGAPTPYRAGQEAQARRYLAQLQSCIQARARVSGEELASDITVRRYAARWIADRKALGLRAACDDETRLKHALPAIGDMKLDEVRPRHLRDLVLELRKSSGLAPRTIRHVYAILSTMFRTAVADELLIATPCVLSKGILPKKVDKDPSFRVNAIFSREELEQLILDTRILEDRRVLYALKGIAGLRHGEAAGLSWRQYQASLEPLGSIDLERTKTQVPRRIPVHPTLAAMLTEWKDAGWERTFGRSPTADDLIVPTRNLTERPSPDAQKSLLLDLSTLQLRPRRGHDLRRTFITLAQVDGARRDLLETITHGPRGDIINVYTTFPWPALCDEVRKLKVTVRSSDPGGAIDAGFATSFATGQRTARNRWKKTATPAGFEPAFMP